MVTPNEMMAALNPEYMIPFAEARVGATNAMLVQAKTQLAAGRYFDALPSARAALAQTKR